MWGLTVAELFMDVLAASLEYLLGQRRTLTNTAAAGFDSLHLTGIVHLIGKIEGLIAS